MGFVRMWNAHRIRLQKAGHIIAGKPYLLYFQPDPETARDCRLSLDRDRLRSLQNIADQDPSQLDDFLPEETMEVCEVYLTEIGGIPMQPQAAELENPYLQQYLHLRDRLEQHILNGEEPAVGLLRSPEGGVKLFRERYAAATGVNLNDLPTGLDGEDDILELGDEGD